MGSAIFTGVTGLSAFQQRLDVIANNIANVNTPGYRSSRVLFQDLFSQTLQGARAPNGNFGGNNPSQVGLGVRIGTIDVNHTQGSLQTTGVASDLAIQGAGFFVLNDGNANFFSRDGSFSLNSLGELVDPATGFRVQGYLSDQNGVVSTDGLPGDLVVPVGGSSIVQATTLASMVGNLNSNAATGDVVTRNIVVFDSLGTPQTVTLTFTKSDQIDNGGTLQNAWRWDATFNGTSVSTAGADGVILFDGSGQFSAIGSAPVGGTFTEGTGSEISIPITAFTGASVPSVPFEFDLDFALVTELSVEGETNGDVTLQTQNGFPLGTLESFNIGGTGTINGVFSNGLTLVIGQVALANFSNVGGLERAGNNVFRETRSSGAAQVGISGTGGRGQVNGGVLEGSNVDLGTEFSNMIITQRGFQANARTITAADTLLQETVNLIR